jgi:RimJ/RimL family protein N-acetyltransferase
MREVVTSTERLDLCAPSLDDVGPLAAMWSDPETMRYIGAEEVWDAVKVRARVERAMETHARTRCAFYTIVERASGAVIGQGGLVPITFNGDEIELGYRLGKAHWGKGYATEVARASAAHGFGALGFDRLVAVTYPENLGSRRVLTKAGFAEVGETDLYYGVHCVLYERVKP